MKQEKEKPKLKLLKFPGNGDVILNRIEALDQLLLGQDDLSYYDELLCVIINRLYFLEPDFSHELNRCADKISESRFWLNEFLEGDK